MQERTRMAEANNSAVTNPPKEKEVFQDLSMALFVNRFKREGKKDPDFLVKSKIAEKQYTIVGSAWRNITAKGEEVISLRLSVPRLAELQAK